ncbi:MULTISPECIES: MBL fold metallo-hydrolase [unclassified Sphingomonas]|uniref:MBL fold metallo-hydrolase n=1 Tax=unclassified Sphingomonas TaxID=196159 RepID=UPI002269E0BC|nr:MULTISPECIES: MBL fold metallo-hydrolase [unclassified Sphingomonas]
MKRIAEGAWLLPFSTANTVLLEDGDDLVLFDAGFADKEQVLFDAIAKLGRKPSDLRHLVFTHGHPDHIGSAAAIVAATGATTWMHAADKPLAENGGPFRPMPPSKGILNAAMYWWFWDQNERTAPFTIDHTVKEGDVLPIAGGLPVIGTPGHCAGQVAFLWKGTRLLIAGDVFMNVFGLADPLGFEDAEEGRRSQRKVAGLDFEAIVFGHGPAITANAVPRIRRKVGL